MYFFIDRHGDDIVRHYHIKQTGSQVYISEKHIFKTIPELIQYHKHNAGGKSNWKTS